MAVELNATVEEFWRARGRGDYFPAAYENRLRWTRLIASNWLSSIVAWRRESATLAGRSDSPPRPSRNSSASMSRCSAASFSRSRAESELPANLIKPGFETELCMRFARPLQGEVTPRQVLDALEGIHPSFEIIETRGDLSRHIALALADNAQQHSVILGSPMRPDPSMHLDQVIARVNVERQRDRRRHRRRRPRQPAQLGRMARAQAHGVRPRHPSRRHRNDGFVRAAVPAGARRSRRGGLLRHRPGGCTGGALRPSAPDVPAENRVYCQFLRKGRQGGTHGYSRSHHPGTTDQHVRSAAIR